MKHQCNIPQSIKFQHSKDFPDVNETERFPFENFDQRGTLSHQFTIALPFR